MRQLILKHGNGHWQWVKLTRGSGRRPMVLALGTAAGKESAVLPSELTSHLRDCDEVLFLLPPAACLTRFVSGGRGSYAAAEKIEAAGCGGRAALFADAFWSAWDEESATSETSTQLVAVHPRRLEQRYAFLTKLPVPCRLLPESEAVWTALQELERRRLGEGASIPAQSCPAEDPSSVRVRSRLWICEQQEGLYGWFEQDGYRRRFQFEPRNAELEEAVWQNRCRSLVRSLLQATEGERRAPRVSVFADGDAYALVRIVSECSDVADVQKYASEDCRHLLNEFCDQGLDGAEVQTHPPQDIRYLPNQTCRRDTPASTALGLVGAVLGPRRGLGLCPPFLALHNRSITVRQIVQDAGVCLQQTAAAGMIVLLLAVAFQKAMLTALEKKAAARRDEVTAAGDLIRNFRRIEQWTKARPQLLQKARGMIEGVPQTGRLRTLSLASQPAGVAMEVVLPDVDAPQYQAALKADPQVVDVRVQLSSRDEEGGGLWRVSAGLP